jgi:hypothetical protein
VRYGQFEAQYTVHTVFSTVRWVRSVRKLSGRGQIDVRHPVENTVDNPVHVTHARANLQSHGLQHVSRGGLVAST